ncbi:Tetratricopeptide repeat-containing protein [Marininema mesophilum]|uniref:Tetratricopeptide repeat-containing protein n=1 Tax=Marininema mesophilum TaxID=1048340 RepID=A0A1H3B637_9BACL|nr:tetratricopeptide repeat protein [Marininema mesophilum]SDX36519.1 Tetratricopeptide repeat-containing protein [Marininema mesophilum]
MEEQKSIPLFDELGRLIWTDREEFRIRVIPENVQADWDHPENLYAFAVQLYRDGFLDEASESVDRILELTDRGEEALLLKGLIHHRQKNYSEAEAILKECIHLFPNRGVAFTYLARLYAAEKKQEQMIDALNQGLTREPNQEMALRMLVGATPDPAHAIALLGSFATNEEAWWPQLELGRIYLKEGNVKEAISQFCLAIQSSCGYHEEKKDPPDWEEEIALMTVTTLLFRHGLCDELIQMAEKYWTPQFLTPYAGLDYVAALEEQGEIRGAIDVLNEMIAKSEEEYRVILKLRIHHLEKKLERVS